MQTKTQTREEAFNLRLALTLCKELDVPGKLRYATNRTMPGLDHHFEASIGAWPEPEDKESEEHAKWKIDFEAHLKEEIDIQVYETDLIEINDTIHVDAANRPRQNNALIAALMPIWKE